MISVPPPDPRQPQRSVAALAAQGRCPRCGNPTLFTGWVKFAPHCRACGLDFSAFNVGDGPAAFLTLAVGALITGLAITLDLAVQPPFWVHVILWLPITLAAVLFSLRFAKALLLTLEYRNQAREAGAGRPDA